MKQPSLFSILFTFALLLLAPNLAAALFIPEAAEIPYQINNSDRIVICTVSEISVADYYTNNTITVKEWLYNPLPAKTIVVRTNIGTNASTEDEAEFTLSESVLLMLKDQRPDKGFFRMSLGFLGKHPVSDRNAVIEALKAQGKWKGEDQTGNRTNETETIKNTGTAGNQKENITENKIVDNGKADITVTMGKQEGKSTTTQKSNSTPFISPIWVLAIVLMVVTCVRKIK